MRKILFLDRDGTLIVEPTHDFQVDAFEDLAFLPKVIQALQKITSQETYELVMVTNQDGLGTASLPEAAFYPPHNFMLQTFESEGITFKEVLIDRTFEHENAPTRKPATGLLTHYLEDTTIDFANSYVIGDRLSDATLAKNIGAQAILISVDNDKVQAWQQDTSLKTQYPIVCITNSWLEIADFLQKSTTHRQAMVQRQTYETQIEITLQLDRKEDSQIKTGIGFFDHMLAQLAKHAQNTLQVNVQGDLHIDAHHTIEDTALALGQAYREALRDKRGISRYGHFTLPMDEALAQVAIDFSGRPYLVWEATFKREKIGAMPTEMFEHFFKSFSDAALCNIYVKAQGNNDHHQIEAIFKAFARAVRMAIKVDSTDHSLPTTKGVL